MNNQQYHVRPRRMPQTIRYSSSQIPLLERNMR